jgi:hypothetical protein
MKVSETTKKILKNFADISPNFIGQKGNKQQAKNKGNSFVAYATIEEYFPVEFGIQKFDKIVKCMERIPDAEFNISKDSLRVENTLSSATFGTVPAETLGRIAKTIDVEYLDVKISISQKLIKDLLDYARLMKVNSDSKPKPKFGTKNKEYDSLVIEANGSDLFLQVQEQRNYANQTFRVNIGKASELFKIHLSLDEWKFIDDDYVLELCLEKQIARLTSSKYPVTYYQSIDVLE